MRYHNEYTSVLKLAAETNFPENHYLAEDERARLPELLIKKKSIVTLFWFALYSTAELITFSIFVFIVTPQIAASSWLIWIVFVFGFSLFTACIISYIVFLKKAFE